MRKELDQLIDEMLSHGINYDDARQIIERRFISRALTRTNGNLGRHRGPPRDSPQHAEPEDGSVPSQALGLTPQP